MTARQVYCSAPRPIRQPIPYLLLPGTQDIVKALFGDREFNTTHRLGAVNSINWARILAQTVCYFLSYFQIKRQVADPAA